MKRHTKKIGFIYIPNIFLEAERMRKRWDGCSSCIVASGDCGSSMIIDVSGSLTGLGIRRGMFLKDARRLKSDVNIIIVDYGHMKKTNDMIADYLKKYSMVVESSHFGEFYIDLTGTERLFGRAIDTCLKIISDLNEIYGFNSSMGIGSNKLISHLAAKLSGGNSVYEICSPAEHIFLMPAKIAYMPDLEPGIKAELLYTYNIQTIKDLQPFSESDLEAMFRSGGSLLYSYSRNIAPDFLSAGEEERVIGRTLVLSDEANNDAIIRRRFFHLVLELCGDMRSENIFPLYFDLKVIYKDNYKYTKSKRIDAPTFVDKRLYALILPHLDAALNRRTCIKKIVLTFSGFIPAVIQESLFGCDDKDLKLCLAFDAVRKKYGKRAIYFAE